MGRYGGDPNSSRHRFSIPSEDTVSEEWVQHQVNLSSSLRVLIRAFAQVYGCRDATCVEFGVPARKAGRPSKNDTMRFLIPNGAQQAQGGDTDAFADAAQDEPAASQPEEKTPDQKPVEKPKQQAKPARRPAEPVGPAPSALGFMDINYGDDGKDSEAEPEEEAVDTPEMGGDDMMTLTAMFGAKPDNGR